MVLIAEHIVLKTEHVKHDPPLMDWEERRAHQLV